MSADKQRSLARRIAILQPMSINAMLADKISPRDASRLWHDGHIRKIRIPKNSQPNTHITLTAYEITEEGRNFLEMHAPLIKTVTKEAAMVALQKPVHSKYERNRKLNMSLSRRNKEDRVEIVRRSARTAAIISEALCEAEAAPFVLDTGWINLAEASDHFIMKMIEKARTPEGTGFVRIDRFMGSSSGLKKFLDGKQRPLMDILGIRALGGGAILTHVESDPLVETYPINSRLYHRWIAARKSDPTLPEPDYIEAPIRHRLIMLSTGEAMNTYVQMLCR